MNNAGAETPSPTAAEADSWSSRAAALQCFIRRLAEWDFPADASIQISVIAGRSCTIEAGGPVIRQNSHADLFVPAADTRFILAALCELQGAMTARARAAASMAAHENEKKSRSPVHA